MQRESFGGVALPRTVLCSLQGVHKDILEGRVL